MLKQLVLILQVLSFQVPIIGEFWKFYLNEALYVPHPTKTESGELATLSEGAGYLFIFSKVKIKTLILLCGFKSEKLAKNRLSYPLI